jgi:hypothetical protein
MFENVVNRVRQWFSDRSDRNSLVYNWNKLARAAFISGSFPTLMQAKISNGDNSYASIFSRKYNGGGFRIEVLSGRSLNTDEMKMIGEIILSNKELVRSLVTLGFHTLEVHANVGYKGLKWKLIDEIFEIGQGG